MPHEDDGYLVKWGQTQAEQPIGSQNQARRKLAKRLRSSHNAKPSKISSRHKLPPIFPGTNSEPDLDEREHAILMRKPDDLYNEVFSNMQPSLSHHNLHSTYSKSKKEIRFKVNRLGTPTNVTKDSRISPDHQR